MRHIFVHRSDIYDLLSIIHQVSINDVGDRLVDQVIQIYQNGAFVPLLIWRAAEGRMEIAYSNYSRVGWDDIIWSGGTTTVSVRGYTYGLVVLSFGLFVLILP